MTDVFEKICIYQHYNIGVKSLDYVWHTVISDPTAVLIYA